MPLAPEENRLFQDEVARFVQKRVLPALPRHEEPLSATRLAALLDELESMGLLPTQTDTNLGLWADADDTPLTLALLASIAEGSASLAFALHHAAMARYLARTLGWLLPPFDAALQPTGHYSLARASLGRWLAGNSLATTDTQLLADWLDHTQQDALVCAVPGFACLLRPLWLDGAIQWQQVGDTSLVLSEQLALGLDALVMARVRGGKADAFSALDADASRALYARLLKMEWLGLAAIGLGTLRASATLAFRYAQLRQQGGAIIGSHPAVQGLLAEIRMALAQTQRLLDGTPANLDALTLTETASLRAASSNSLLSAAHQVIQVHGGSGYMRDTGPEKYMRDIHMLRQLSGGVAGLPLFIEGVAT